MDKNEKLIKIKKLIIHLKVLNTFDELLKMAPLITKTEDYISRFSTSEDNRNLLIRNFPETNDYLSGFINEDGMKNLRDSLISLLDLLEEHITDDDTPTSPTKLTPIGTSMSTSTSTRKVFIVHGHNTTMEIATKDFLITVGLEPIILHEQSNTGKTIIEKFEANANEVDYAIVLFSPDDEVHKNGNTTYQPRPNVILELGYFMGKLGRNRVSLLLDKSKTATNIPSDILGYLYNEFDAPNGFWRLKLTQELKAAGYNVDANNLI